jgi:hypothetical protein
MDPVTAAILAAVAAGLAKGAGEVATKGVADAYKGLKSVLRRRFGGQSDIVKAVEDLEARPESKARQEVVREEVEAVRAPADAEVVAAAQRLLENIREMPGGETHVQQAIGNYIAQADRGGHAEVHIGNERDAPDTPTGRV